MTYLSPGDEAYRALRRGLAFLLGCVAGIERSPAGSGCLLTFVTVVMLRKLSTNLKVFLLHVQEAASRPHATLDGRDPLLNVIKSQVKPQSKQRVCSPSAHAVPYGSCCRPSSEDSRSLNEKSPILCINYQMLSVLSRTSLSKRPSLPFFCLLTSQANQEFCWQ